MIKKVEIYEFSKKPKFLFVNKCNTSRSNKNYSLERGKKYSQLFNKILSSNKSDKKNTMIKSSKNIALKKNNIKKITLFKPEELKLNKYSNILKNKNNINSNQFLLNKKEAHNIKNNN